MYEPDADMIFNYLMVSALANAAHIIESKNLKASGGEYQNYSIIWTSRLWFHTYRVFTIYLHLGCLSTKVDKNVWKNVETFFK